MQLYNGDCLEIMKSIPDKGVDCILHDLRKTSGDFIYD